MKKMMIGLAIATLASGCATSAPAPLPAPEKVGPAPSQPGNCFYRGADGKVFISAC